MPKDETKTIDSRLQRLYDFLNNPETPENIVVQILQDFRHKFHPKVSASIKNFLFKWLTEAESNNPLYEKRLSLIIQYGKTDLLDECFEKIALWIFNAPSQKDFAFRTSLTIRPRPTSINQELTEKIIDWIVEGIGYGETESNRRTLWILQSPYATAAVTAALKNKKFEVMEALVNCRDSTPFSPFCTYLYTTGTEYNTQRSQVSLILNSGHQNAINVMLNYLVGWVFDKKQDFSEQCLRLQLILSSNCKPAIDEIARYITGWILVLPDREQIYAAELILNSMQLKVICAISPYLIEILNKLSTVYNPSSPTPLGDEPLHPTSPSLSSSRSCALPVGLFNQRAPRHNDETPPYSNPLPLIS